MAYINVLPNGKPLPASGKAAILIMEEGAEIIPTPNEWEEGLVCVVDNGAFEAALYAHDQREIDRVKFSIANGDKRPMIWLKYPPAKEVAR